MKLLMQGFDLDVPPVSHRHDYKCGKITRVRPSYCDQTLPTINHVNIVDLGIGPDEQNF